MQLIDKYPDLASLSQLAQKKLPKVAITYLESGTGSNEATNSNLAGLARVKFASSAFHGEINVQTNATFLDDRYDLPVGIAPIGMSGFIWPNAENVLANFANQKNLPYVLSHVACESVNSIKVKKYNNVWFQIYPPKNEKELDFYIEQCRNKNIKTLVVTVDVPRPSVREEQIKSGLTIPPSLSPKHLLDMVTKPKWLLGHLRKGQPLLKSYEEYHGSISLESARNHIGYQTRTAVSAEYLKMLRRKWQGNLICKGITNLDDAIMARDCGVDSIWVSNHGGRQSPCVNCLLHVLENIRETITLPIVYDGGIRSSLDVLRAINYGADLVMMGRPWHLALGALASLGPTHLKDILSREMISIMWQLGLNEPREVRNLKRILQ